ncbi:MAG: RNA ligase family protein [Stygiobacter sp.]
MKYQHIERLGAEEVEDLLSGECYVFPKIDGTNGQLWWNNGLCAGSRNRELSLENDNQGFMAWAIKQENIKAFFEEYPDVNLFGEWLVPHTLRTYKDTAWNKFYVFDIIKDFEYMHYETYKPMLEKYNIEYIPALYKVYQPTETQLIKLLDKNVYLIKEGEGYGEGLVIKRYGYKNKYYRTTWAKLVSNDFKSGQYKAELHELKAPVTIEQKIVNKYVTEHLVLKEKMKIHYNTTKTFNPVNVAELFNRIYYSLITEEAWHFIKEHKNPTIDFKKLYKLTIEKVKQILGV